MDILIDAKPEDEQPASLNADEEINDIQEEGIVDGKYENLTEEVDQDELQNATTNPMEIGEFDGIIPRACGVRAGDPDVQRRQAIWEDR